MTELVTGVCLSSPVTRARLQMQEKVDTSRFILCRLAENSTMLSIHSPKPRRHWSRCHTEPSQKISFPSSGLDLKQSDSLWEVDTNSPLMLLHMSIGSTGTFHILISSNLRCSTCTTAVKQRAPGKPSRRGGLGRALAAS